MTLPTSEPPAVCEAANAAETFAMHRMIPIKSICLSFLALGVFAVHVGLPTSNAQPPRVAHADIDYAASGYVTPAGMVPPEMNPGMHPGMVMPVNYDQGGYVPAPGPVPASGSAMPYQQMGYGGYDQYGACDQYGSCDACDGGCDGMGCGGKCGCLSCCVLGEGGLIGRLGSRGNGCGGCGAQGCPSCGGLTNLRHFCIFCQGDGCSACQMFGRGYLLGCLSALAPYQDAGRGAQRWYDLSAEALFLSPDFDGIGSTVLTTRGIDGTPVLRTSDAFDDDLEAGMRLSAALIFGAGGNIEGTYMGGQEWNGSATALSPAETIPNPTFDPVAPSGPNSFPLQILSGADLYSFISEFGTNPNGGFDDTDRSISQSISMQTKFDSGELNYRRRTVGPYSRFQGSWLFGLRYLRVDNRLGLDIVGLNNDGTDASLTDGTLRFFNATDDISNDLFGAQIGGDVWWNVIAGVNLGVELKGAWLKNEARRNASISANSIAGGGPGTVTNSYRNDEGTFALELSAQAVYRLTHSWSFRSAYYLISIDDIANAGFEADAIRSSVASGSAGSETPLNFDTFTVDGFSFGAEYIW